MGAITRMTGTPASAHAAMNGSLTGPPGGVTLKTFSP